MKFLSVSSLFPPDAMGGAELSCYNCAKWLSTQGHKVSVLTTARTPSDEAHGVENDGITVWRIYWPRVYPVHIHAKQSSVRKGIWHLQDHFHPANQSLFREIVERVQPDVINLHLVSGIGHNALSVLKTVPGIRVIYFLHDLGLGCVRSNMFRSGINCQRMCLECRASSFLKFSQFAKNRFTFVSPSAANLETLKLHTDLGQFRSFVMPNFDLETSLPRTDRAPGSPLRFIYVGRLHNTKGVGFLLKVMTELVQEGHQLQAKIVGGGPEEQTLRKAYANNEWVTFTGRVPPQQVKSELSAADVFCLPSIWRENHPGVVRQALRAGVPALVSDSGGSSEMIEHGKSGIVLPTGDSRAWKDAIRQLIQNRELTNQLQDGAIQSSRKYDTEVVGRQMNAIIQHAFAELGSRPDQPSRLSVETHSTILTPAQK